MGRMSYTMSSWSGGWLLKHTRPPCASPPPFKLVKSLDSNTSKHSTCYLPVSACVNILYWCGVTSFPFLAYLWLKVSISLCFAEVLYLWYQHSVAFSWLFRLLVEPCGFQTFSHCDEHASRPQSISYAPASCRVWSLAFLHCSSHDSARGIRDCIQHLMQHCGNDSVASAYKTWMSTWYLLLVDSQRRSGVVGPCTLVLLEHACVTVGHSLILYHKVLALITEPNKDRPLRLAGEAVNCICVWLLSGQVCWDQLGLKRVSSPTACADSAITSAVIRLTVKRLSSSLWICQVLESGNLKSTHRTYSTQ